MNVVTGAFGFIGRYIARGLLASGEAVCTITTHPDKPNPFGAAVEAVPYNAPTRFTEWIEENWGEVGRTYSSELGRHFIWRGRG